MGLLKDLIDLGYADFADSGTMNDWLVDNYGSNWSDLGYDAKHYGATDAFQSMTEDLAEWGFADLADKAFGEMMFSIEHYQALYDYTIDYDFSTGSWFSVLTGEPIADPYEWIRD